jgi:hypothetical protein
MNTTTKEATIAEQFADEMICTMQNCDNKQPVFGLITKLGIVRMCVKCVRINFDLYR